MSIKMVVSKTLLRKYKRVDSWFICSHSCNIYRGCSHNCVYCDGRSEKYNVGGLFGQDISVKINAPEVLKYELELTGNHRSNITGFIALGGGVGDSYQSLEKKYKLTRQCLEIIAQKQLPVILLTKSDLILRDIDLFKKINLKSKVIVGVSFSTVDSIISKKVEPLASSVSKRLSIIKTLTQEGISCGMILMPLIPKLTDSQEQITAAMSAAKEAGALFVLFGDMTLKEGRQKDYFNTFLIDHYPEHVKEYYKLYKPNAWGGVKEHHHIVMNKRCFTAAKDVGIAVRIPADLFSEYLDTNTLISVLLSQMDYMMQIQLRKSSYGYAAYSISKEKEPLTSLLLEMAHIKGINADIKPIIAEILKTRQSKLYKKIVLFAK